MPAARQMLKPAQLRLLQAIAEHGQVQLAAEIVGMSQPAASRMLAETERQLGASLFLRQPRGMVPTEFGLAVLRRAAVILREMAGMVVDLENLRATLRAHLPSQSAELLTLDKTIANLLRMWARP